MKCPKCHADTTDCINYCSVCGYKLVNRRRMPIISGRRMIIVAAIVIFGFFILNRVPSFSPADHKNSTETQKGSAEPSKYRFIQSQRSDIDFTDTLNDPDALKYARGTLTLKDVTGAELASYPVITFSGGWMALPVKFVYLAYDWDFHSARGGKLPVEGAVRQDDDEIGLWRIDESETIAGPELMPWNPELDMNWIALDADLKPVNFKPDAYSEAGSFAQIRIPENLQSHFGYFIQEGTIVGWTFGNDVMGGFLWLGAQGTDLYSEFRTYDLYRLNFMESREESFLIALAQKGLSDEELLIQLTAAFENETKMPEDEIPLRLSTKEINHQMTESAKRLLASKRYQTLANSFDLRTLLNIQNPELAATAVEARLKNEGIDSAFEFIRRLADNAPSKWFAEKSALDELQRSLYIDQIKEAAESSFPSDAFTLMQEARNLYPSDPAIHLAAVRLYLSDQQWQVAEELLRERSYPESFRDAIANTMNRISELKGLEGKTVIRFRPGAGKVPVKLLINEKRTQQFVIDTGATVTTIPPKAATALGLDSHTGKRRFYSAGGTDTASEVTLDAIAINQLLVHNLTVLVIELPQNDDLGLLGMDFLNHFKMNLNIEQGILTLEPRKKRLFLYNN